MSDTRIERSMYTHNLEVVCHVMLEIRKLQLQNFDSLITNLSWDASRYTARVHYGVVCLVLRELTRSDGLYSFCRVLMSIEDINCKFMKNELKLSLNHPLTDSLP
jgi:hypothetical protein